MNENMAKALNDQINFEMESAYLYLAMSLTMKEEKYPGFGSWLEKQYHEELEHAHKLMAYLEACDKSVDLQSINIHKVAQKHPVEIAKIVLAHEQKVTQKIHALYEKAYEEKDYATHHMLGWFVSEQIEEEATAREIIDSFTFAGENRASQMLVDSKLGNRQ